MYESALDRGKTAILHEEALRGVHVLSVGHLGPGKSVDVVAELAMPLTLIEGIPILRIPATVGQLYGASPLLPSDDFTTSENALQHAELSVLTDTGSPRLPAGPLTGENGDNDPARSSNRNLCAGRAFWNPRGL